MSVSCQVGKAISIMGAYEEVTKQQNAFQISWDNDHHNGSDRGEDAHDRNDQTFALELLGQPRTTDDRDNFCSPRLVFLGDIS